MPDTNSYLILGFVVVFGVLSLYIGSLVLRLRNAQKDKAHIQALLKD